MGEMVEFRVITAGEIHRELCKVAHDALSLNKGKRLDLVGAVYGIRRTRGPWYWPFKEPDKKFRARILGKITQ